MAGVCVCLDRLLSVWRVAKAPVSAPWLVSGGAVNCIGVSRGAEIGALGVVGGRKSGMSFWGKSGENKRY